MRSVPVLGGNHSAPQWRAVRRQLFPLFVSVFLVMVGFGIALPVLPFFVERLALEEAPGRSVAVQVGFITAVYPLMQLFLAPVWGRWSDRVGRRPLVLLGIVGFSVSQVLFGLANSLWLLYAARILGGALTAAIFPAAAAYVADKTSEKIRSRGMAWLGTSASLGVVVGPALSGILASQDIHLQLRYGHVWFDRFSIPFLVAAAVGLVGFVFAYRRLGAVQIHGAVESRDHERPRWGPLLTQLWPHLSLALAAQFALASFEGTFAVFAGGVLGFSLSQIAWGFLTCGLVMAVMQVGIVGRLGGHFSELSQIRFGFVLMATGMFLLFWVQTMISAIVSIVVLALGMALVSPNLAALFSKSTGSRAAGTALGLQNAAVSLGQFAGPALGGVLFSWRPTSPYLLALLVLCAATWRTGLLIEDRAEAVGGTES